jgi:transposase
MTKIMPKTQQEEKYRWIKPVLDKQMKLKDLISVCPFSERAIKYWLSAFRQRGMEGLVPKSTRPKSNPKETPIRIKERVLELRKEHDKCALKLHWSLEKEGISIHPRTIGKILKSEGLPRRYRIKKVVYKYIRSQLQPGELIEIDVKYVPQKLDGKNFREHTGVHR